MKWPEATGDEKPPVMDPSDLGIDYRYEMANWAKAPLSDAAEEVKSTKDSYQRVNKTIVNLIKKANTLPGETDKRRAMRQLRLSVAKSEAAWDAFDAETKQAY